MIAEWTLQITALKFSGAGLLYSFRQSGLACCLLHKPGMAAMPEQTAQYVGNASAIEIPQLKLWEPQNTFAGANDPRNVASYMQIELNDETESFQVVTTLHVSLN